MFGLVTGHKIMGNSMADTTAHNIKQEMAVVRNALAKKSGISRKIKGKTFHLSNIMRIMARASPALFFRELLKIPLTNRNL
ncbi:MAG: hypothetical protein FWC50_16135 [Planctomycetaceae bacterium]|nr:hypothetical protein [Planctomycetaceae bacterium]